MNSPTTRPVVVGVDGRPGSAGALRYAVAEARRRRARLQLVHVVPSYLSIGPPMPLTDLHRLGTSILRQAEDTVRRRDPDLDVSTVLAHGDPIGGLVKVSEGGQVVVVGRETRHGLDRLLTGTTTASVAAKADCDVVVVPSFWVDDLVRGRVVVGIKSSRDTHELLSQAFAEASARGAAVAAVMAWHLPDPYFDRVEARAHAEDWEANATQVLEDAVAHWRTAYPQVPVETRVVHGSPARVLLKASSDSDLVVVSRRRLALSPYGHLGGVVHALLRVSDVPVLVVPYVADVTEDLEDLVLEEEGVPVK
jgi:nucleotide-binding universal stress UspA family protein